MADKMMKKGGKGDDVSQLQTQLTKLGYAVKVDGHFGDETDTAVKELQTMFGYDVDGIVGPGTSKLIEQQLGYGWNKSAPDAFQKAQQAQGKGDGGSKMGDGQKKGADVFGKNPQQQQGQKGAPLPPEKTMGATPGQPQSPPKQGMAPKPQGAKK
jgi:peptidoglycan hydrolase-like protein with peptidoglycan-binding domain